MGSFFFNLQIRTVDQPLASMMDRLTTALTEYAAADGYELAKPADEVERELLVLTDEQSHWATVIDSVEDFEDQAVRQFAQALSKQCDAEVVSVMVEDSDILRLNLLNRGALVDCFSNLAEFDTLDAQLAAEIAGQPAKWQHLLAPGATADDLAQAWRATPTFVEDMLADIATLLQMNPRLALASRYDVTDASHRHGNIALHLRFRVAAQDLPIPEIEFSTLPTQFAIKGRPHGIAGRPGDEIPNLTHVPEELKPRRRTMGEMLLWIINRGGASKGIVVILSGTALEQGLIRLTELVLIGRDRKQAQHLNVELVEHSGQIFWQAKAEDFQIPVGVDPLAYARLMQVKQTRRAFELEGNASFLINMVGEILAAGEGFIDVVCIPLQNPSGAINHTVPVYIVANQRRLDLRLREPSKQSQVA